MKKYLKKVVTFIVLVTLLSLLIISLFFFTPEEIVNKIGVENAYIILFFISFFGGLSAGGALSFIAALVTFAAGGLNPLYLGITAGVALTIGDIIMFVIGEKGRELITGKLKRKIDKFSKIVNKKINKLIPLIIYLYMGFTPFPNDIIILSLVAIKYPRKKAYLPIMLGDITFTILIAFLAAKGIMLFT